MVADNQLALLKEIKSNLRPENRLSEWKRMKWLRYDLQYSWYHPEARYFSLILTQHFKVEGYQMCVKCHQFIDAAESSWKNKDGEYELRWIARSDNCEGAIIDEEWDEIEGQCDAWIATGKFGASLYNYHVYCPWCTVREWAYGESWHPWSRKMTQDAISVLKRLKILRAQGD